MTKTPTEPIAREYLRGIVADEDLMRIPLMDLQDMAEEGVDPTEAIAYLAGSKRVFVLVAKLSWLSEQQGRVFQGMADCYELVMHMVEKHGLESAQAEIEKLPKTKVVPVVVEA